jgi:hypothetical protein
MRPSRSNALPIYSYISTSSDSVSYALHDNKETQALRMVPFLTVIPVSNRRRFIYTLHDNHDNRAISGSRLEPIQPSLRRPGNQQLIWVDSSSPPSAERCAITVRPADFAVLELDWLPRANPRD